MEAHDSLREVIERLAPMTRRAGSAGEARAADWLAERLERAGAPARVEPVTFRDGYARLHAALVGAATVAGAIGGRRPWARAVAATALAALVDDVSNGPRVARRLVTRPQPTQNVVAEAGDRAAERTLVVYAHHDAAPTGAVFDQSLHRAVAARFPEFVERTDTAFPIWWPVAAGPLLVMLGRRRTGTLLSALNTLSFLDIARNRIVPGANDNLSGCAALVGIAERLRERPVSGVRVLLVSCGAEEVCQGGIYGFVEQHALPRDRTWFLGLDSIGAPRLLLLEGEGPFRMEDYNDRGFRDLVAAAAERAGVPLRRRMRARASTDAVIPNRAGYPTTMIVSVDHAKTIPNYHLMSDVPEHIDYGSVDRAAALAEAVARDLAAA
jgi:acetylornithine deacetylase/succinyl-diaminopimelate desuccinylase-like protein